MDEKEAYLGSVASGYAYWWGDSIEPGASPRHRCGFTSPAAGVRVVTVQVGAMERFGNVTIQN